MKKKERGLCRPPESSYQHEPKDVATIWTWHTKTAAEKTHPSTLLPLGTTGQDETALQDDRPAACVLYITLMNLNLTRHSCWERRPTVQCA